MTDLLADPTFNDLVAGYASKGVEALQATLVDAWDKLTSDEKLACTRLLYTIAKAHLLDLIGRDVSDYIGTLQAALLQWKVVGKQVLVDGFKQAATEVFGLAGAFAGSALAAAIKAAV